MIDQFLSREFGVFLLTGGIAAIVNFGSRILYSHWCDLSTAIILAYLTGMCTAFVLARRFVFKRGSRAGPRSALIFTAVNVVAAAQTWAITLGLDHYVFPRIDVTRFAPELAHAVGIAFPVFTSYLGHKHWSFR